MVTNIFKWVSVILPAAAVCLAYVPQADARTRNHDCDRNPVLQDTVNRANPGDVVAVSGMCTGQTIVAVNNLTLDGTNSDPGADDATLDGGVIVRANGVHIKRFIITGSSGAGISVEQSSSAVIEGNFVQNNAGHGVSVSGGSYARIGPAATHGVAGDQQNNANVIELNGVNGIDVRGSASADLFDNLIDDNQRGVEVAVGGSANMAGNMIQGSDRGISLSTNGSVAFVAMHGIEPSDDNTFSGNTTDISCESGGAASGSQQNFLAPPAVTNIDPSCAVDSAIYTP